MLCYQDQPQWGKQHVNPDKNSTCLLPSLNQLDVGTATSVQTYDFSTLCTYIPHKLLKSLVHSSFRKKDGSTCCTHVKVGRRREYLINFINGSGGKMYTADQTCNMINFLVDNIFVKCLGGGVYFVKLLESLWEQIVLHCSLSRFFSDMKVNF